MEVLRRIESSFSLDVLLKSITAEVLLRGLFGRGGSFFRGVDVVAADVGLGDSAAIFFRTVFGVVVVAIGLV